MAHHDPYPQSCHWGKGKAKEGASTETERFESHVRVTQQPGMTAKEPGSEGQAQPRQAQRPTLQKNYDLALHTDPHGDKRALPVHTDHVANKLALFCFVPHVARLPTLQKCCWECMLLGAHPKSSLEKRQRNKYIKSGGVMGSLTGGVIKPGPCPTEVKPPHARPVARHWHTH